MNPTRPRGMQFLAINGLFSLVFGDFDQSSGHSSKQYGRLATNAWDRLAKKESKKATQTKQNGTQIEQDRRCPPCGQAGSSCCSLYSGFDRAKSRRRTSSWKRCPSLGASCCSPRSSRPLCCSSSGHGSHGCPGTCHGRWWWWTHEWAHGNRRAGHGVRNRLGCRQPSSRCGDGTSSGRARSLKYSSSRRYAHAYSQLAQKFLNFWEAAPDQKINGATASAMQKMFLGWNCAQLPLEHNFMHLLVLCTTRNLRGAMVPENGMFFSQNLLPFVRVFMNRAIEVRILALA
jgi:hypothetical protein